MKNVITNRFLMNTLPILSNQQHVFASSLATSILYVVLVVLGIVLVVK